MFVYIELLSPSQVYDSKKLASHYLHLRAFIFDLISLIPLDILQFRFGTQPLLRFPRFFKVSFFKDKIDFRSLKSGPIFQFLSPS